MRIHTHLVSSFTTVSLIIISLILVNCGGGSSSKSSTPASTAASSAVASSTVASSVTDTTITISGAAVAKSTDVTAVASLYEDFGRYMAKINPVARVWAAVDTGSNDNEALPNATVELVKVFGGGKAEEIVDIGIVTTDDAGASSIPDVEKVPPSDGTSVSFYYEVRVTKDELTLKTPIAAESDVEANVSPETDLAAKRLSEVVAVPGVDNPPLPSNKMVESVRELVIR